MICVKAPARLPGDNSPSKSLYENLNGIALRRERPGCKEPATRARVKGG